MKALIVFALATGSIAVGQVQPRIGIVDLTRKALQNHPDLLAARADIESAQAKKTEMLAPFRPLATLNGYSAFGSGSMIFPGTVDPINDELLPPDAVAIANATFMWRLFTFGRDRDIASSGAAAVRLSEDSLATESLDTVYRLRIAFAEALQKHESVVTSMVGLENAKEILRVTNDEFGSGKVPQAFVLRAKAEVAAAEGDLAVAQAEEVGALAQVWDAAGMDQSPSFTLGDWDVVESGPVDLPSAIAFALNHRPEMNRIEEQVKKMKSIASASTKSGLPELSLMGMSDFGASRADSGSESYKAGLVISFPLTDGGNRRAQTDEANAAVNRANQEQRALQNQIQAEVVADWAKWQASSRVREAANSELESSEEAYRVALLRYQAGKAILSELIDAKSQLAKARLATAEADAYHRKAWAKMQRSIGDMDMSHSRPGPKLTPVQEKRPALSRE